MNSTPDQRDPKKVTIQDVLDRLAVIKIKYKMDKPVSMTFYSAGSGFISYGDRVEASFATPELGMARLIDLEQDLIRLNP